MRSGAILAIFILAVTLTGAGLMTVEGEIKPLSFFNDRYEVEFKNTLNGAGDIKVEMLKDSPEVRLKKWNGEVDMGVYYGKVQGEAEKSFFDDKIVWKDINSKEEVHAYPIKAKAGMEDGGFEIEVLLSQKPATNKFDFTIDGAENLDFFYQPDIRNKGFKQADNVIGSYAVYHKINKNHIEGGINYGTGKAYHIYRPKAIDANGKEAWAVLRYEGGVLSVTVPQDFLDNATYPVLVDPTFGYTTIGGTSTSGASPYTNYMEMTENSPAGTNTLTNISIAFTPGSSAANFQYGLYSESGSDGPANRLVYDISTWQPGSTAQAFYTNPVAFSYALTADTKYWIAAATDNSTEFWFDVVAGKDIYYGGTMPLPAVADGAKEPSIRASAYATYTVDTVDSGPTVTLNASSADLDNGGTLGNGLVGLWTFDGKDTLWGSNTVVDRSGSGNTGTMANMSTSTSPTPGKLGQGLMFDGVDDEVDVSAIPSAKSISFWFKPDTTTKKIIDLNGTQTIEVSAGTISANNFATPTIYVDGVAISTISNTDWHFITVTTDTAVNASAITIGRIGAGFYGGKLDEVRIYNRALSANEVKQLYSMGRLRRGG